jgi:hypothetical protein
LDRSNYEISNFVPVPTFITHIAASKTAIACVFGLSDSIIAETPAMPLFGWHHCLSFDHCLRLRRSLSYPLAGKKSFAGYFLETPMTSHINIAILNALFLYTNSYIVTIPKELYQTHVKKATIAFNKKVTKYTSF